MIRKLLNLIATISLILAFTAIIFWIRSYYSEEALCYGDPNTADWYAVMVKEGLLSGEHVQVPGDLEADYQRGLWAFSIPNQSKVGLGDIRQYRDAQRRDVPGVLIVRGNRRLLHGRDFENSPGSTFAPAEGFGVPLWTVTGLLLLLPIARMASLVQSRRRAAAETADEPSDAG